MVKPSGADRNRTDIVGEVRTTRPVVEIALSAVAVISRGDGPSTMSPKAVRDTGPGGSTIPSSAIPPPLELIVRLVA